MKKIDGLKGAFLKEWEMYVQDVPKAGEVYKYDKAKGLCLPDAVVKAGQIRLLADIEPPLLVYACRKVRGEFAWEVIPMSPFHFPATSGEVLIGNRVYQVWNKQTIPAHMLIRSFEVQTVSREERLEIKQVLGYFENGGDLPVWLKSAMGFPIRDDNDVRLRYLSDFAVEFNDMLRQRRTRAASSRDMTWRRALPSRVLKGAFSGYELRLAAAGVGDDYTPAVVANRFPRNARDFKKQYVECELKSDFLSLLPGERGERPLVYTWEGDTPEGWKNSAVAAYISKTGELFGVGSMDVKSKRIVINDFSGSEGVSVALEKASELRLVMVPLEK